MFLEGRPMPIGGPEGPPVALVRNVDAWNDQILVASGGIDETWTSMYHKHGFYGMTGT